MIFHAPNCGLCRDIGILELSQGPLKTLGKCWCEWDKCLANDTWELPRIPVEGFHMAPLEFWKFKPTIDQGYSKKIDWWIESIKIAEEFWQSLTIDNKSTT